MVMRAAFRKADLTKAYQAVENGGGFVRAVEIEPNGTIRLLTGTKETTAESAPANDWVLHAGKKAVSRA